MELILTDNGTSDTEKTGPVSNKDLSTRTHTGMLHGEMIVESFIVELLKPLMLLIFSEAVGEMPVCCSSRRKESCCRKKCFIVYKAA